MQAPRFHGELYDVEGILPFLQARGRFRTEYAGDSLRDHLGLERPAGHVVTRGAV